MKTQIHETLMDLNRGRITVSEAENEIMDIVDRDPDSKLLNWLQWMMINDNDYCEIFLAGLRNLKTGIATSFQIESNPEKFKTINAPSIRDAIRLAIKDVERSDSKSRVG